MLTLEHIRAAIDRSVKIKIAASRKALQKQAAKERLKIEAQRRAEEELERKRIDAAANYERKQAAKAAVIAEAKAKRLAPENVMIDRMIEERASVRFTKVKETSNGSS